MLKPIPYGKHSIDSEDINAVIEVLHSDYLTQGPKIQEFEEAFCQYVGSKYAVAVSSGTAALHLSALALEVNAKTKVITSPLTFSATANCVKYCGGEVVFADVQKSTGILDCDKVESLLKKAPKGTFQGIITVDLAGLPSDTEDLHCLAKEFDLWIIEDASHAPGGYFHDSYKQKQECGNNRYVDLSVFSFHPVKHIACGEGGIITANNEFLNEKLRTLRTHGITKDPNMLHENPGKWYYEMQSLGYNYRLSDIHAALGVSQLKKADKNLARRREIAQKYDESFAGSPLKLIQYDRNKYGHAYHLYIIQTPNRDALYKHLRERDIHPQVHYIPVHLQPYYQNLGFKMGDFPVAESFYSNSLSLPMFPTLSNEQQKQVLDACFSFFS